MQAAPRPYWTGFLKLSLVMIAVRLYAATTERNKVHFHMIHEPSGERCLYRATLEPLEPVSSVGSGDAFLAGFVAARYGGREVEDCLRFAVACGAESTQPFGAGELEQREVERLAPDVRVEQLETPAITVG